MYEVIGKAASEQEWLELRQRGLGGSDASCVVGINPFTTRDELWDSKRQKKPTVIEMTPALRFGSLAEGIILDRLNLKEYEDVVHDGETLGTLRSKRRPWQLANIDAYVVGTGSVSTGVEIKTCDQSSKYHWLKGVPKYYYAQVQHYMAVTGWQKFDVWLLVCPMDRQVCMQMYDAFCMPHELMWALVEHADLIKYEVLRDEAYINRLNTFEMNFWEDVTRGNRPGPVKTYFNAREDEDFDRLLETYNIENQKERLHRGNRQNLEHSINQRLGGARGASSSRFKVSIRNGRYGEYMTVDGLKGSKAM